MWFHSFLYALVGIATAFLAIVLKDFLPDGYAFKVGADAVETILTILASSMLAVATFSLSVMVTVYGQVSSGATPRAAKLLIENQSAQSAVATFIGAFLYSIVGIIALTTNAYGEKGRFILFIATIGVTVVVIAKLIRWVDQLSNLGRVGDTVLKIEKATMKQLEAEIKLPKFGGQTLTSLPEKFFSFGSNCVGFISFIDVKALQKCCEENSFNIFLECLPGSFYFPSGALAYTDKKLSPEITSVLQSYFSIDAERSFKQDPRFGFILLSEVASRALSPGINDPGTAILVIGVVVRILSRWKDLRENMFLGSNSDILYNRIFVPEFDEKNLFKDFFPPVLRDGAGLLEIGMQLQKSFTSLFNLDPTRYGEISRQLSHQSLIFSLTELKTSFERKIILENARLGPYSGTRYEFESKNSA